MDSFKELENYKNVELNNSDKELRSFYSSVISIVCSDNYKELYKYAVSFLEENSRALYLFGDAYLKHLKYANYDIDYSWLKSTEIIINTNPRKIVKKKFNIRGAKSAFSRGKPKGSRNIEQSLKKGLNSKVIYIAKRS